MGNRAVITTRDKQVGVYLHWNGGRKSVEAFLHYCRMVGYRSPDQDSEYGFARLCQVIANFFGFGGTSVGVGLYECLDTDNGDNGVYIIEDWKIVGREYQPYEDEDSLTKEELLDWLTAINKDQPKENRPTKRVIEDYVKNLQPFQLEGYPKREWKKARQDDLRVIHF